MILQVGVADAVYSEALVVLHALSICNGVLAVEREVEVEVRELLLQLPEVLKEERLAESACAVEEVELAVGSVQRLCHVHDLSTQRSHTCTTTNPNHLLARSEVRVEVAVRT